MMTGDWRVKVLDFGLAEFRQEVLEVGRTESQTESLSKEGHVLGTVPYMSPEQAQGRSVDHRSDIFSLGIILYELSTGRRPFHGQSTAELISSILRDAPPLVTEHRSDLPRHLARIVRRCLEKNPNRRYQITEDLRNDLEDLRNEIDSEEAGSGKVSTPEPARLRRRGRRRRNTCSPRLCLKFEGRDATSLASEVIL